MQSVSRGNWHATLFISEGYFVNNHLQRLYNRKKKTRTLKNSETMIIHPSIHSSVCLSSMPCFSCNWGHWALAKLWLGEAVTSGVTGHIEAKEPFTLYLQTIQSCQFTSYVGYLERSHTDTDNMQTPNRKGPGPEYWGRDLMKGGRADCCTTMSPDVDRLIC